MKSAGQKTLPAGRPLGKPHRLEHINFRRVAEVISPIVCNQGPLRPLHTDFWVPGTFLSGERWIWIGTLVWPTWEQFRHIGTLWTLGDRDSTFWDIQEQLRLLILDRRCTRCIRTLCYITLYTWCPTGHKVTMFDFLVWAIKEQLGYLSRSLGNNQDIAPLKMLLWGRMR